VIVRLTTRRMRFNWKVALLFYFAFVLFGAIINSIIFFKPESVDYLTANHIGQSKRATRESFFQRDNFADNYTGECHADSDCNNNGECQLNSQGTTYCNCDDGYITTNDDGLCGYHQRRKLVAFLFSFFLGSYGVDWFYLYNNGNGGYIVAGVFKIITLGGCTIWWLIDWIRVLADAFPDGNGEDLEQDL